MDELSFQNGLDFIWREGLHASEENSVSEAPVQSGWLCRAQGPCLAGVKTRAGGGIRVYNGDLLGYGQP